MSFPRKFQLPTFMPFIKGGEKDLRTNCTTNDFRIVASAFHSEFFSEHPDTEIFTSLVKCILAKILDERTRNIGQEYKFQVFQVDEKEETAQAVFARVDDLYSSAYNAYIDTPGKMDTIDDHNFGAERVKTVVKALQGMSITTGAALYTMTSSAHSSRRFCATDSSRTGACTSPTPISFGSCSKPSTSKGSLSKRGRRPTHPNNRMPYLIPLHFG
jgi:hypothetical protein